MKGIGIDGLGFCWEEKLEAEAVGDNGDFCEEGMKDGEAATTLRGGPLFCAHAKIVAT